MEFARQQRNNKDLGRPPSYEDLVPEQAEYFNKAVTETPPPRYEEVVTEKESLWTNLF